MAPGAVSENVDFVRTLSLICRLLRVLRLFRGLTVREVAWRCGVERSDVSRLEAGRTNVSLRMPCRLCKALDTDIWMLCGGRESDFSDSWILFFRMLWQPAACRFGYYFL